MDVMYNIPSDSKVVKCIITKEAVEGGEPTLIRAEEDKPRKAIVTKKSLKKNNGEIA